MRQAYESLQSIRGEKKVAFVVMQFASTPWNFFDIVADALESEGYLALRADHAFQHKIVASAEVGVANREVNAKRTRHTEHLWTLLKNSDFVLVDITNWNVNVYIELGVAAAWAHSANELGHTKPKLGVIGAGDSGELPFNVQDLTVHRYNLKDHSANPKDLSDEDIRVSIQAAVRNAAADMTRQAIPPLAVPEDLRFVPGTATREFGKAGKRLLKSLPSAVTKELCDPGAAVLATRYMQFLGARVGEELAALTGFPKLPSDWHSLDSCTGGTSDELRPPLALPSGLEPHARRVLTQLLNVVKDLDHRVAEALDAANFSATNRRLVFARALTLDPGSRSSAEAEVLSEVLGNVAANWVRGSQGNGDHPVNWESGLAAIVRLNRFRAISVSQNTIRTIEKVCATGSSGVRSLDAISTLGGAYFLGHSIGVLSAWESEYRHLAVHLAASTIKGQSVTVQEPREVAEYRDGLVALAPDLDVGIDVVAGESRPDFVFAIEHPFHFRVLLELLSDENRRYAAECILNYQALKETWATEGTRDRFWKHFSWFRDQLPVVVNLGSSTEGPVTVFEQHYIGFGRTPHTSSFMRMTYEPETRLSSRSWWPEVLPTGDQPLEQNLPNSDAIARAQMARQQLLGRLWRGAGTDLDLAAAAGETLAWDGRNGPDDVASIMWDVSRWPGLLFPELVVAELQCGLWMLQALTSRLRVAETEADSGDGQAKVADQTACVLGIIKLYLKEYVSGEDGLRGLSLTLETLRQRADGPMTSEKVGILKAAVEKRRAGLESFVDQAHAPVPR